MCGYNDHNTTTITQRIKGYMKLTIYTIILLSSFINTKVKPMQIKHVIITLVTWPENEVNSKLNLFCERGKNSKYSCSTEHILFCKNKETNVTKAIFFVHSSR